MTLTKEDLNDIARSYHEHDAMSDKFIEDECQFYTYRWVFSHVEPGDSVLEMGFGEGNFTEELVKRGFTPVILDGSDLLLRKAEALHGNAISTAHSLFEEYEPGILFDAVLATHVLEHVDDPVALLLKMKTWIKPGGRIIILVPNSESIHRQLAVIMNLQPQLDSLGARDRAVGHQRVYSLAGLEADVRAAGLQVRDSSGFFLKTLPNSMMLEYSRELIQALNQISPKLPTRLLANIGLVASLEDVPAEFPESRSWQKREQLGYYQTKAEDYEKPGVLQRTINRAFERKASILFKELKGHPRKRVLEVGTGSGLLTYFAFDKMKPGSYTAIDLPSSMIAKAATRIKRPGLKFMVEDALRLSFPDNTFDTLIGTDIIHHMEDPVQALREWLRVAEKGGRLAILESNIYNPLNLRNIGLEHEVRSFLNTDYNLRKWMEQAGWKNVTTVPAPAFTPAGPSFLAPVFDLIDAVSPSIPGWKKLTALWLVTGEKF